MNKQHPLCRAASFLVRATVNSNVPQETRLKRMNETGSNEKVERLYGFGFLGVLIDSFGAVFHRPVFSAAGNIVIEDHACRVVRNALTRYFGKSMDDHIKPVKPGRMKILKAYLGSLAVMKEAYRQAGVSHITEYARVLRLFRYYVSWKGYMSGRKNALILLARTNDQKRLALGTVCEELGTPCLAFTVERIGCREPAPFIIERQFCWTQIQKSHLENQGIKGVIMPVPEVNPVKTSIPDPETARCGILLNAQFDRDKVAGFILGLRKENGFRNILVRPHPGNTDRELDFDGAMVCNWRQPLREFLDGLDLAFCLNSNAIIDSLLHGIPVVYAGGLDSLKYDLFGFVQDGILPAYAGQMRFPDTIREFFTNRSFSDNWNPHEFSADGTEEAETLKTFLGDRVCLDD